MKTNLLIAGLLGATGVAFGAFGAHGLPGYLSEAGFSPEEIATRLETFVTGTRYQLHAAVAVLAIGLFGESVALRWATRLLAFGAVVFCGLLYVLAYVEGWRWLGAVVPLGGLAMIGGWVAVIVHAVRATASPQDSETTKDPTTSDLQREVIRLEEVITHQQQLVQDLNEALTETCGGVDETARRQQALELTVKRLVEQQQGAVDAPDERPPHY